MSISVSAQDKSRDNKKKFKKEKLRNSCAAFVLNFAHRLKVKIDYCIVTVAARQISAGT